MGWTFSPFTAVVLVSATIAIAVGLMALRHRPDPLVWPLAVTMFAVAGWAVPHAVSFGFTSVEQVAFWHRLRYPGTVLAPVAFLVLVLRYAGYERWLTTRSYAALMAIPVLTVVAVWTNPVHGLFWRSLSVVDVGGAAVLDPTFGPWYWVNLGYLYLITIVSLLVLGRRAVRSGPIYRKQAAIMFVGGAVPLVVNGVMQFGLGPEPMVDLTTTALTVSGLTFAVTLFRLDLLEIRPVARARLFDELDDGVMVVGPNGRIRDYNPTAERVLGDLSIDQRAEEVLPSNVLPDGGELVVDASTGERRFRTRSAPLTDRGGRSAGRIIYLNDVTELVERDQRLSVLNRILRHNIRNELNVADGQIELVAEQLPAGQRARVETARASIRNVVNFAEKARYVEQTLQRSGEPTAVSAARVVDRVVTDARAAYPSATITAGHPDPTTDSSTVRVVDAELFEMAIAELVENAVVHSGRDHPQVTVSVDATDDHVQVRVADNGVGIPEHEREILRTRTETHLEHSSGLGLWLVKWTVSSSSGELSFSENEPQGTVVCLTLPAADG